ncbi:hypothetical protein PBI_CANTARE_36 [Brevibacterium phage Cantare]|uniref:Minor tail protein gp31 C-terminal domain-containing protein n=1 Tax=Brevibacterium phage Cantare TaxID=2338395 RepID=A0A3G3LYR7_9CAUD|nr:hypothetical protein PQD70_gp036 [Brevibacterium phage Cantare]AYQ99256.1 hypothetical protein PBI_CANTARE_36 [Brevibacterium phage Cantare]
MAETNTTRLGLRQWSSDSDTVNRPEFNDSFKKIEQLVAIDKQGLSSARPAPGVIGTYYYATDTKILWRDTGTGWQQVGNRVDGFETRPTNVSGQAIAITGLSGQASDLVRLKSSNGDTLSSFDKSGSLKSGGVYVANNVDTKDASRLYDASLSVSPLMPSYPAQVTRALTGQTANLHEFRTSNGAIGTRINNAGHIVTQRAMKDNDTDTTNNNEFVTRGQLYRSLPQYTFRVMSLSQYNALLVKDSKTLYVIVG